MIARRAVYLALTGGALIAALYTGDRLYVLILAFMLAVLLFAALHIAYTLASFRFSQSLTVNEAIKGGEAGFSLSLHNEGPIPYGRVEAVYWLPDNLTGIPPHKLTGDIPAGSELKCAVSFLCAYRGEYEPGLREIRINDLFGLLSVAVPFERYSVYYRPLRLTVRPRVLRLSARARVALIRQGRMDAADVSAQEVSSVRDIRTFRPGDALKWIHFKLSARRSAVLVREFEGSARPKTLLLLDVHAHGREGLEALEIEDTMVEAATALAHHLLEERAPVRLVAYGRHRYETEGAEPRDFGPMYAYFALAAFDGSYALTDVLALEAAQKGQQVIVITTSLDPALYGALLTLHEAGNDVAAVVVASAQELRQEVHQVAGELTRRGVRCGVAQPGGEIQALGEVLG